MGNAAASRTRRIVRWMLLVSTLFGLAAMHTLGHASVRMDAHSHIGARSLTAMTVDSVHALAIELSAAAPVVQCARNQCDGHGQSGGMSGWSICLAVLTGIALIGLVVTFLSDFARGRWRRARHAGLDAATARPPPKRLAGLPLRSIAVLRI